MSERDIEDEKEVDKKEEDRQWEEVYERMRAAPEGMIRQNGSKELEGGMKSEALYHVGCVTCQYCLLSAFPLYL